MCSDKTSNLTSFWKLGLKSILMTIVEVKNVFRPTDFPGGKIQSISTTCSSLISFFQALRCVNTDIIDVNTKNVTWWACSCLRQMMKATNNKSVLFFPRAREEIDLLDPFHCRYLHLRWAGYFVFGKTFYQSHQRN